jgi:hydroxyacylglutathione hydrolase
MPADTAKIALEDNFEDIISKVQRAQSLTDEALATKAGIPVETLRALKQAQLDEPALARLAPVLNLHAPSLLASARRAWYPRVPNLTGLAQVNTAWHDFRVNAFIIWHPATKHAAIFDTGTDPAPLLAVVKEHSLRVELLLITHTHSDHVACFKELRKALGQPKAFSGARGSLPGAEPLADGATLALGALHIEARRTSGHAADGLTYVVHGLAQPAAVVGDALFAGSMGGARSPEAWAEALQTNRTQIFSLPDDTVLCPGHGPRTTVGQEKLQNPFYPEFK